MPTAYLLARICEEFSCLPSEAWREWQTAPMGLIEEVIEARHYSRAKALVDEADRSSGKVKPPDTRMVRRVQEIELCLAAEDLAKGDSDG